MNGLQVVDLPINEWVEEYSDAACAEGWDLLNAHPGGYELSLDTIDTQIFPTNADAWKHVWSTSASGSKVAKKALDLLKKHCRAEYDLIRNAATGAMV